MTKAWYAAMSMLFSYLGVAIAALVVLLALRKSASDAALHHRVRRNLTGAGCAGSLRIISEGRGRLRAGQELAVPYEGTIGSSMGCDICIPLRKVHLRSAFFWIEGDGMHIVPLQKDGYTVDSEAVGPGDEAIMEEGAILGIRELELVLRLSAAAERREEMAESYVTSSRKGSVREGRGRGIGDPGRREVYKARKKGTGRTKE